MSYVGPRITGRTTTVYNISVNAAWTDVARSTLDDINIGPRTFNANDVIVYLMVENTHATQSLRVQFRPNAGEAATEGMYVPALSMRVVSLYGQNVSSLSFYGSGAATTGTATMTWGPG